MRIQTRFLLWPLALFTCAAGVLSAPQSSPREIDPAQESVARDREIASLFAPVFYQALGDKPRNDYITNFDFDGDWLGDNNWRNVDNDRFALNAYVYYSVSETSSHIFIHYAVFHPRDYKGGELRGLILGELLKEGKKRGGQFDPTGLAEEAALAHENDMEGCLIVVAKSGSELKIARVVFVETLHHNQFSKYVSEESGLAGFELIKRDEQQVLLYVEPKGHGIMAYDGSQSQISGKKFLIYKFAGKAEAPKDNQEGPIGYDLLPIESTLWSKARTQNGINATYGAAHDYRTLSISVVQTNGSVATKRIKLGKLGSAFLGKVGGRNRARPPWAWYDLNRRDDALGLWFFDPAKIVKRDFNLDEKFSTAYVRLPFWAR